MNKKRDMEELKREKLLDEIASECIECRSCMNNCRMLSEYVGSPKKFLSDIREGKEVEEIVPFSCSLCSKCEHYCPKNLNMGEAFMGMRRGIIEGNSGVSPLKGHKGVYAYQNMVSSKLMSASEAPVSAGGPVRIFLPGCSLPAYSPSLVRKTFDYLKDRLSGTGMVMQCCGSPASLIGDEKLFEQKYRILADMIDKTGASEVITACQNCYVLLKKKSPHYNVRSLWTVMAELGLPEGAEGKGKGSDIVFTVHDSCPTRYETGIHDSVREIVSKLGYEVRESEHSREKTSCCGAGGMIYSVNPELARKVSEDTALNLESEYVITYCASCREAISGAGKKTVHLLDMVFGGSLDSGSRFRNTPDGSLTKWINRYKVKIGKK
jgi:Fe-S oxidoreductase